MISEAEYYFFSSIFLRISVASGDWAFSSKCMSSMTEMYLNWYCYVRYVDMLNINIRTVV